MYIISKKTKKISFGNLYDILSNPNFLRVCWERKRCSQSINIPPISKNTVNVTEHVKFVLIASSLRRGGFKFTSAFQAVGFSSTKFSERDQIVLEGMQFLLEIVFKSHFSEKKSHFIVEQNCHKVLSNVKKTFKNYSWFVTGELPSHYYDIDNTVFISFFKKCIKDPLIVQLIQQYVENKPSSKGLDSLLFNIYLIQFDFFFLDFFIHSYKQYFYKFYYVRSMNTFLIGVRGSKKDCIQIQSSFFKKYFKNKVDNIHFSTKKYKRICIKSIQISSAKKGIFFLGYTLKQVISFDRSTSYVPRKIRYKVLLMVPVDRIVKQLFKAKLLTQQGIPITCGQLVHLSVPDVIHFYREVKDAILYYYSLADNFRKFESLLHYRLLNSCALTLASKLNLTSVKKVFNKFGREFKFIDSREDPISYKKKIDCFITRKKNTLFFRPLHIQEIIQKIYKELLSKKI